MNLSRKKQLAARTLNIGKERIIFVNERLDEIKEAITKQDIRDLHKDGAIKIRNKKGRKKIKKRKTKRREGKIKKKVKKKKRQLDIRTIRKLRDYVKQLQNQDKISKEKAKELRKKIKNRMFRNKAHLKDQLNLEVKNK